MKRVNSIFLLLVLALAFAGAARVHERLRAFPFRRHLDAAAPLMNAPPLVVFTTVALGGFRGLLADLLWMRAVSLQDKGKVFEMAQLADWITKLEPHFTTVWAFHAWNMAYNISLLFPDPEDRWRWIQNGIRLLRDEGLALNPANTDLYRELGWIYQHKIGYVMDRAHKVYKLKLAAEMEALFPGPRPDYRASRNDPRLIRLRDEYKLDPAVMEQLEREYGPLDWRLAESQALYWAWRGLQVAPGRRNARCEQMIFQCLAAEFRQGRLETDPASGLWVATPNFAFLEPALRAYESALAHHNLPIFHMAYAGFLGEAVFILHVYNRIPQAQALYRRLVEKYSAPSDGALDFDGYIRRCFERYAADRSSRDAVAVVEGFLYQGYYWMVQGDDERAAECELRAEEFWQTYLRQRTNADHLRRTGLPPLDVLRRQAWRRLMEERAAVSKQ